MADLFHGWIYNLADYRHVFALSDQDFQKKLLDYPGRISSVNAELNAMGYSMVSVDPLYRLPFKEMQTYVEKTLKENSAYLRNNLSILSLPDESMAEKVITAWRRNSEQFLADYETGQKQGRYRAVETFEHLKDRPFELLLCADFLFNLETSKNPPQKIMNELCEISSEVRIFPVEKTISAELGPMMLAFQQRNFGLELRAVTFPQRHNGHAMLRVWAKECEVS